MKKSEAQTRITEKEVARYWDGNADLWTKHVRKGWDTYREYFNNPNFFKFVGSLEGKKVLDSGCGEGYNTRILAQRGAQVTGVDISQKMIGYARQRERKEPLGIRYEVASFSDLKPFDNESFDIIVSSMALMDSPGFSKSAKEFFRVLRKKGDLFFSITHPCFMTRGFGWVEDTVNKTVRLTVSDYFSEESWVEHWKFSELLPTARTKTFAVPTFPRTLSDYFNGLTEAGFILKRIKEPRPTQRMCRLNPDFQRWRDTSALFLYIHALKP
jgi:ubiquinone/menaquinone biosynthesis C-methylase UbiE